MNEFLALDNNKIVKETERVSAVRFLCVGVCMLAALCLGAWLTRFGVNFTDEPAHFVNSMHWQDFPESPLTYWLGSCWGKLTGWNWLASRMLGWGLCMGGIIVSCWWIGFISGKRYRWWLICALLIAMSSIQGFTMTLWGYDATAYFATACALIAWLAFCRKPSSVRMVLLIFVSVVAIGFKVTCVSLVAVVAVALITDPSGKPLKVRSLCAGAYLLGTMLGAILLLVILYGNPFIWFRIVMSGEYGSNSLRECVSSTVGVTLSFLLPMGLFALVFILVHAIDKWPGKIGRVVAYSTVLVALVGILWAKCGSMTIHYSCSLLLLALGYMFCQRDKQMKWMAIILLAFAEVTAIGSNTGTAKLMTWALFPVIAWRLRNFVSQTWVQAALVCIIIAVSANLAYVSARKTTFDVGVMGEHATMDNPRLSGLLTSIARAKEINGIDGAMREVAHDIQVDAQIMVVGDETSRYFYEYLYSVPNYWLRNDWRTVSNHDTEEYVSYVRSRIRQEEPHIMLFLKYRGGGTDISTKMSEMLDSAMTRYKRGTNFIIYIND